MREALAMAREALGADAVVLSSAPVMARGWRGLVGGRDIEIAAAVDRMVSEDRTPRPAGRQGEGLTSASGGGVCAQLCAAGFDRATAEEIAGGQPRRSRQGSPVRAALNAWTESMCAQDPAYARVEVFVGPPGAGKTTTVARIAAQERARKGTRLSLISADGFRVGAIEQLRLYADIIGTPFDAARTASELDGALHATRAHVLVDTAGRSVSDEAAREMFAVLARRPDVRTHLVIPACSSRREAERIIARHAAANPTRVVLTKLDEAESIAPLAGFLRACGLPVSYVGVGQRVPEDLVRATPSFLAAAMLGEAGEPAWSAA